MAELPPRLSDQQKFILAELAAYHSVDKTVPVTQLSWRVAREFDQDGDKIWDRKAAAVTAGEDILDTGEVSAEAIGPMLQPIFDSLEDEALTPSHRASFSRALDRLEERGLLERVRDTFYYSGPNEQRREDRTKAVRLTDEGAKAGREVKHRDRDGRYSLSFDSEFKHRLDFVNLPF